MDQWRDIPCLDVIEMKQSKDSRKNAEQRAEGRSAEQPELISDRERPTTPNRAQLADAPEPAQDSAVETSTVVSSDLLAQASELARRGELQDAASAYRAYLTQHPEAI